MRITLLIDVETDDIPRLQRYSGEQPPIELRVEDGWRIWGRFIGAKEAIQTLQEELEEVIEEGD